MSSRRPPLIAVLILPVMFLLSLVVVQAANAKPAVSPVPGTQTATATITIHSFAYSVPSSVRHGALVRVVNRDGVTHTVTSNQAGKFNVKVPAHSARSFHAPGTPMKYGFHCTIHPGMKGVLKVR